MLWDASDFFLDQTSRMESLDNYSSEPQILPKDLGTISM